MSTDVKAPDNVMSSLLMAAMHAANAAAKVHGDEDGFYYEALHDITHLVSELYGTAAMYRELCSNAALILMSKGMNVRVGEMTFRREQGIWTFDLDDKIVDEANVGLRRAGQLIVVYANLLQQMGEEWTDEDADFEPSADVNSDVDAWNSLYLAIPEDEMCSTVRAICVIASVLYKWVTRQ